MKRSVLATALSGAALLPSLVSAQITTESVDVGGLDAIGCQNASNPPTLTGGAPATAVAEFTYDSSNGELTLVVTNTTPLVPLESTAKITQVYFNLPHGAVTGLTLDSQSAAGGATPNFAMTVDYDTLVAPNPNSAGCVGVFGVNLATDVQNGIANGNNPISGNPVIGPATFEFTVSGPNIDILEARTFARSFSTVPPGTSPVNVAMRFQAGGVGAAESGTIGSSSDCAANAWYTGTPCIGNTLQFTMSGAPGCHACLIFSIFPGPTQLGSDSVPIGLPAMPFGIVTFPNSGVVTWPVTIPNDPLIAGATGYFAVLAIDVQSQTGFSIGNGFSITVCG